MLLLGELVMLSDWGGGGIRKTRLLIIFRLLYMLTSFCISGLHTRPSSFLIPGQIYPISEEELSGALLSSVFERSHFFTSASKSNIIADASLNICHVFVFFPADIISTVEFNHTGELLATGDKGGRVVIFQQEIEVQLQVELYFDKHQSQKLVRVNCCGNCSVSKE